MLKSLNEKVDYHAKASFAMRYGVIYVGDKGIEFYDNVSKRNFVQIPWKEVEQVRAHVVMGGKYIRGFNVDTKTTGTLVFLVSDCKNVLRAMKPYLKEHQLLRMKTMVSRIKDVFTNKD